MAQRSGKKQQEAEGLTQAEAISVAVAVGWMVAVGIYFWTLPSAAAGVDSLDGPRAILLLLAVFLPVALIWVAAGAARAQRDLRADLDLLAQAQDSLRQQQMAQAAQSPQHAVPVQATPVATVTPENTVPPDVPAAIAEPVTRFTSRREVSRMIVPRQAPKARQDQPVPAPAPVTDLHSATLDHPDLVKALNFPDDENDTEGFAALRRALRDRDARQLVQASQDVLTLLSQDGIYMDDLRPDPVPTELWRRFANGERGAEMDALGAIKHPDALHAITGRMREDTIFRDAVHHFLRRFDQMLVSFAAHASDADLLALAETRTARAFMLLGRAAGTFA